MNAIHRRQVLTGIAVLFVTLLMQEHAARVVALLVLQPGRAVFRSTMLSLEHPFAVVRSMDCLDTPGCLIRPLECDVDAKRQVLSVGALPVADGDLLYVAVLSEILRLAKGLEQIILSDGRSQACDIDEVLLHHSDADEVLPILFFGFTLLQLLMPLVLGSFPLVLLDVGTELGNPSHVWSANEQQGQTCAKEHTLLS